MSKYTQHYNFFEYEPDIDKHLKFKIKDALNDNFDKIDTVLHVVDSRTSAIGDTTALETLAKDTLVNAINENTVSLLQHNVSNSAHVDIRESIATEISDRQSGDSSLQQSITNFSELRKIVDVVANYADLASYYTPDITRNSMVIVLHDEEHDNAKSLYYWTGPGEEGSEPIDEWAYYMSFDIEYTKAETDTLLVAKADKSNTYTKAEINALMTSLYTYKGTVAKVADLPSSNNKTGDTYNVASTGANYTWDGTEWDKLSETAVVTDLTNYYDKSETDTLLAAKASTTVTDSISSDISSIQTSLASLESNKAPNTLSTITDAAKVLITSLLSPSDVYDDLTLENSTFVAPTNGYYSIVQSANAPGEQVKIVNTSNGMTDIGVSFSAGTIAANLYVGAGQTVQITSTATGNIETFRFVYAVGSVSEQPVVPPEPVQEEEPNQEPSESNLEEQDGEGD